MPLEEDIWIIVISAEIVTGCSSAVGADVKPSERSGFTAGSPLSQHKCKRDNDDRVRRAGSLLPLLVYDATGAAPAFIFLLVFSFLFSFFSRNQKFHDYITAQFSTKQ